MKWRGWSLPDSEVWEHVLLDCGFVAVWDNPFHTQEGPAWRWSAPGIELVVFQCWSQFCQPDLILSGNVNTGRVIGVIFSSLPTSVPSREDGLKWLARFLQSWGRGYPSVPHWLQKGRDLLADERAEFMARYRARPQAIARRDRLRPELRAIRALADDAPSEVVATFHFDGEILRFVTGSRKILIVAEGEPWPEPAPVFLSQLQHLPKRLMHDPVIIDVWNDSLRIDRSRFRLAPVGLELP